MVTVIVKPRKLFVYAGPDLKAAAQHYAVCNDIEDELEHEVVITWSCPPRQMFITEGSLFDALDALEREFLLERGFA